MTQRHSVGHEHYLLPDLTIANALPTNEGGTWLVLPVALLHQASSADSLTRACAWPLTELV